MSLTANLRLQEAGGVTAYDDAGANDGTSANTIVRDANAMLFAAATDLITVPAAAAVDDIFAGGGTFSAWVNVASAGGGNLGRLFDKDSKSFLFASTSVLTYERDFDTTDGKWTVGFPALNERFHFAMTYNSTDDSVTDGSIPVIYINGVSVAVTEATASEGDPVTDAGGDLIIGNRAAGDRNFDGTMSDIRVDDSMLTATEIYKIANPLTPLKYITNVRN